MNVGSQPTVSVLTTVYNHGLYLDDAVASVIASTWQDWEMIILDDCSSDDSLARARKWAMVDSRVRVIANPVNRGDYPTRSVAASHAQGVYLKCLDADDVMYPHTLAIMVEAMREFPEAGLALSYNLIDDDRPSPQQISSREAYLSFLLGGDVLAVGPSAAIIRRDLFEKSGGFGHGRYVGDIELWLKLAAAAPVVKLPPALVWWRRHEGQQIRAEGSDPSIASTRHRLSLEALDACGRLLTDDEKRMARRWRIYRHARSVRSGAVRHGRFRVAWRQLRDSGLTSRQMCQALVRQWHPGSPTQRWGGTRRVSRRSP